MLTVLKSRRCWRAEPKLPDHLAPDPDEQHLGTACGEGDSGRCKRADDCTGSDAQLDGACPGSENIKCCVPQASGALGTWTVCSRSAAECLLLVRCDCVA